ncbi:hypothetical protein ACLEPN_00850 [Myxococcus sp. 1LA]
MRKLVVRLAALSLATFGGSALAAGKAGAPGFAVKPLTEQDLTDHAGAGCTLEKGNAVYWLDDFQQAVVRVDGKVFELKPRNEDTNLSTLEKKGDTIQYADATEALTAEVVMLTSKTLKLTLTKEGKTASVEKLKLSCGD